jgi:DNA recombination protein RmuC
MLVPILLGVLILLVLIAIALLVVVLRQQNRQPDHAPIVNAIQPGMAALERAFRDEVERLSSRHSEADARQRDEIARLWKDGRDALQRDQQATSEALTRLISESFFAQNQRLDAFEQRLNRMMEAGDARGETLRKAVEQRLDKLREENSAKLEEMRVTVDEKLQGTLDKRLGDSFKQVSERLEQVHKGLGEMQSLATGVGDLKKVMTNVKARGTWGEFQLGALLEQILAPAQYQANVAVKPGTAERVEFAICLPGRDGSDGQPEQTVFLPIDAKFPAEDYQRLVDAHDAGDTEAIAAASKQLDAAVRLCARTISEKYIAPPHTTDFAILFVPTEGLFAEIVRRPSLVEHCQQTCRVVIAGPTTLAALLNSLQMGFRTLAIQQRSSEVWEVLGAVKTEFAKFGGVMEKVKKKLQEATNTVSQAEVRTRAVQRSLRVVEELPAQQALRLLGIDDSAGQDAIDDEDEPSVFGN